MSRASAAVLVCAVLSAFGTPAVAQRARRSVECSTCIANWYYFDENAASPAQRDWNCGTSSYDGHRGSDWSLAGGNGAIAAGHNVVAIADGTVVAINEGAYDTCTACSGTMCGTAFGFGYGNYLRIDHGTRSVTYAHMRRGSLRVGMGARVTCGQVLGQIASSGCSTGAHLHTEFRTIGGTSATAYDPYMGSCSPTSPSVWTTQNAYRTLPGDTCDGMTPPPTCPSGTFAIWTCDSALTSRTRCISGVVTTEMCPNGCESRPVGVDDVCRPPPACTGTTEWQCNTDRSGRRRCNAGTEQTETCAMGCRVADPGDDVCNTTPTCPTGLGAAWVCTADARSRQRCVSGRVETESCQQSCAAGTPNATCVAGTVDAGATVDANAMSDASVPRDGPTIPDGSGTADGGARRDAADGGGNSMVDGGCACRTAGGRDSRRPGTVPCGLTASFIAIACALRLRRRSRQSRRASTREF